MPVANGAMAADFCRVLRDPERARVDGRRVMIAVAHPDDETLGCGALLARLEGVSVVIVTDGAPKDLFDARNYGFATAEAYASARRNELRAALALAGVDASQIHELGISDQQATLCLKAIVPKLVSLLNAYQYNVVITHAYEGGHPDHDAVAFATRCAAEQCAHPITLLEMPLYRAGPDGDLRQSFACEEAGEVVTLALKPAEKSLKREMLLKYATQRDVLSVFSTEREQYREAPDYDFTRAPNNGRVLYDRENWGMRTTEWLAHVSAFLAENERKRA